MSDWRYQHREIIDNFLKFLNGCTENFVLKGETSLMKCYGLKRFSEDIDLDARSHENLEDLVKEYCAQHAYTYRVGKDTDTVKRFFIYYGPPESHSLKVETSYRRKNIDENEFTYINGVCVYKLDRICQFKINAYSNKDKLRDLYDLVFIINQHWDSLSRETKNMLTDCFQYKGLEQFDYLIREQSDTLIDNEEMAESFLSAYDKVGLLISKEEKDMFTHTETDRAKTEEKGSIMNLDNEEER